MSTDPFAVKRLPKWHPRRLAFKSLAIKNKSKARTLDATPCPRRSWPACPSRPRSSGPTLRRPLQMRHLLHALAITEHLAGTVVVEVGAYRGETTRCLARATSRTLVAVDPFIGYGGAESEYRHFQDRIAGMGNVVDETRPRARPRGRRTARRAWCLSTRSMITSIRRSTSRPGRGCSCRAESWRCMTPTTNGSLEPAERPSRPSPASTCWPIPPT